MKSIHEKIIVQYQLKYGTDRITAINETAHLILKLTHRKSLSLNDMEVLEELGFDIEMIPRSIVVDDNGTPIL